ncbi:PREDICTED: dynein heavy chain 2, axonemal-like, partial [Thamnophis sirtalis]|uniref:Dynein heavy chain 2, axonemal-like n=2 Tax=Thamnophis TaxID=34999 RepID=A0A6I9Z4E4_9SAUR
MWTNEHLAAMDQFLKDVTQTMIVFYVDEFAGLKVEPVMPHQEQKQLAYFIRQENAEITEENFHEVVQFGSVRRPYIDSLMRVLNAAYLPRLFRKGAWPESIKNEFFSEIYHFMTTLTDTHFKMKGRTVLYIPIESFTITPEMALKDKAAVQRLE